VTTDATRWVEIEDAIHTWVRKATGLAGSDVRFTATREEAPALNAPPRAYIRFLAMSAIGQQARKRGSEVQVLRLTVTDDGPGTVGIDFYPARSSVAQPISIVAGAGDPPSTSAAALVGQLATDLPAGYSAAIDPDNSAAILLSGSTTEPLFAAAALDASLLAVTTSIPRYPAHVTLRHQMVWRVEFRAADVRGAQTAAGMASKCVLYRATLADPAMANLGFLTAGWRGLNYGVPIDRAESTAFIDAAWIGDLDGFEMTQAARNVTATNTATQLAS
jgi:hypothetical protein